MQPQQIKKYLFTLLARREYSTAEIRTKLARFDIDESMIEATIKEFQENGWQSDSRYLQSYFESKKNKYGNLKLQQELKNKGMHLDDFTALLPDKEHQIEIAKQLLTKKYHDIAQTIQNKQKCYRYLVSKGFSSEITYEVIECFFQKE